MRRRFLQRKEPDCPAIILFHYSDRQTSGFPRTKTVFLSLAMGQSGALYVSDGNNDLFTYSLTTQLYHSLGTLHGVSISAVNSFVAVPEPDSFAMFGLGALTLAFAGSGALRRRRLVGFLA